MAKYTLLSCIAVGAPKAKKALVHSTFPGGMTVMRGCSVASWVVLAALLFVGLGTRVRAAETLVQRMFDVVLEGDDPGEGFTFDLPFNLTLPTLVRFDGFFENLSSADTGVLYRLTWTSADGTGLNGIGTDFARLPGAGSLPLKFDQPIGFTPDSVRLYFEGGGPADNFRVMGDFTIEQVPEPGSAVLSCIGAMLFRRRRRRES